jgi:succinoglycan biosynthesis transport protein ExoP
MKDVDVCGGVMLTIDQTAKNTLRFGEPREDLQQRRYYPSPAAADAWEIVLRYRRLLTIFLASGILLSILITHLLSPIYTATSVIVFDRNDSRPYEAEVEARRQERDRSTMETELDVIRSRVFVGIVVDALKLVEDPHYNTYLALLPGTEDSQSRADFVGELDKVTGQDTQKLKQPRLITKAAQRDRAISTLLRSFSVDRNGESLALSIKVEHPDPARAAEVADAIAQRYVNWTSHLKELAIKNTLDYLRKQANELAASIANKEREIAAFTAQSDLTFDPKDDLLRARTEQLNEQLTLARVEETGARVKLKEARQRLASGGERNVGQILASELLTNLRTEEGRLLRLRGQLSSKYGDQHPLVIDADAELASNRKMIADEASRMLLELENAAEIARLRVGETEGEISSLEKRLKSRNLAEIRRRELERDLLSDQKRYDTLILRLNVLNPAEEEVKPAAMIASFAEVPVEPSFPKPIFMILAGVVGTAILAVVCVIAIASLDNRLYKPSAVEAITGRPNIIALPNFGRSFSHDPYKSILQKPSSALAGAIRSLCLAWRTLDTTRGGKVLMIASTAPGEGRTTLSLAMAATAKANGLSAIVVDLNPSPQSARALSGIVESKNLEEVVNLTWEDVLGLIEVSPNYPFLDVIASKLTVKDYRRLFKILRESYDLVIVDSMPASVSEDAVWLSSYVDSILLVVRAGKTREDQLAEMMQRLNLDGALLLGSVMNFYGKGPNPVAARIAAIARRRAQSVHQTAVVASGFLSKHVAMRRHVHSQADAAAQSSVATHQKTKNDQIFHDPLVAGQ